MYSGLPGPLCPVVVHPAAASTFGAEAVRVQTSAGRARFGVKRPVDSAVPGEQSFRLVQQAAIRPYTLQCRHAKQLLNGFELTFRGCLAQCVRYSLHGNTFVP